MIKISKLADYGVVVMSALASHAAAPGPTTRALAATDVSLHTHVPTPTVAKVLKLLAKGGLISSVRGAQGGYLLARTPAAISLAEIISAVDGPVMLTECSTGHVTCSISEHCSLQGRWNSVNRIVAKALADVSLAQLISQDVPAQTQSQTQTLASAQQVVA